MWQCPRLYITLPILPITLILNDLFVHHKQDTQFGKNANFPPILQVQEVGRYVSWCYLSNTVRLCVVKNKDNYIMTLNRTPASVKGRPCHIFYY